MAELVIDCRGVHLRDGERELSLCLDEPLPSISIDNGEGGAGTHGAMNYWQPDDLIAWCDACAKRLKGT